MKKTYKQIAIIGGGVMGTVLVRALTKVISPKKIIVCEKNIIRQKELRKINSSIQITDNLSDCILADIVFLAVKPQDFGNLKLIVNKQALICSIMAGVSITKIRKQLKNIKIVRMMPNMASRVDEGFTVWTTTLKVNNQEKKWVKDFLSIMGVELYVKTEQEIDKATAIIGSGPAYIFNILSIFINSAEQLGFNRSEARLMVRQVLRGVDALANEGVDFTELTRQVTSKGGTTEAALQVFTDSGLKKTWIKAVNSAYKRAQKLSK